MVTLKDIANEAGVSKMTVSNVLNGNHSKVSQKTIEKVNTIIKKYNYIPNSAARSLSVNSSKIIALCLSNTFLTPERKTDPFESPYNSRLIGNIQRFVEEHGYYLMLCGGKTPNEILNNLRTWNVDGAIFLGGFDNIISDLQKNLKVPLVFFDSYSTDSNIVNIGTDDYNGGYLAGKLLANNGHTNIAFASNLSDSNILLKTRFQGFLDALAECQISFDEQNHFHQYISYEGGIKIGQAIAARKNITAVFATADVMAIGIMEGARLSGLSLPRDLSVIGFDDLPISSYVTPKLTTIKQDIDKKAELAIAHMFQMIEDEIYHGQKITFPVQIVERQSVIHL